MALTLQQKAELMNHIDNVSTSLMNMAFLCASYKETIGISDVADQVQKAISVLEVVPVMIYHLPEKQ